MGRPMIPRKVIRGVIYKKCSLCEQYKPTTEFWPCRTRTDHLQNYCKDCKLQYQQTYRKLKRNPNEWFDYHRKVVRNKNKSLLQIIAECNKILDHMK